MRWARAGLVLAGAGGLLLGTALGVPLGRRLEPGDVVTAVDGRAVTSAAELRNELARAEVGSRLRLTVLREGHRPDVEIDVEQAAGTSDRAAARWRVEGRNRTMRDA